MLQGFVPSIALPKYFSSEWSFAQFRLTHDEGARSIVGFGSEPNTLLIITMTGSLYKVRGLEAVVAFHVSLPTNHLGFELA